MNVNRTAPLGYMLLVITAIALWIFSGWADAAEPEGSAESLRAQYTRLRAELAASAFQRPLYLESSQANNVIKGDAYAVVSHPFSQVGESLDGPRAWCEILILHLNTKYCHAEQPDARYTRLSMNVGKKFDQPLEDSYRLTFDWRVQANQPDYLRVALTADAGPLGTRDYRIVLEATPITDEQTFVHLSYAYGFGLSGKLAMQAYLGTVGRGKVGFTVTGRQNNGAPQYIDGMRGLVERNTMRYYLAIEAFLGALSVPESRRFEKRIVDWFKASERYPRQLHEMEEREYLDMKRREYRRQLNADGS